MTRYRMLVLAGLVAALAGGAATTAFPQATKSPYIPPVKGQAQIAYTRPQTKVIGGEVITTLKVKNMSTGRIAGFKVDEFWYDKQRNPVTGSTYRHPKPMDPGETISITLKTPKDPKMDTNQYNFTHANGTIKPTVVKSLDEAGDEGAKKKAPAAKKAKK